MQSSIFAYDSAIEMKTCRGNKVTDIKLGMISLFFHYLQRIPFLIQNVHVWLTFSIKIILHRIISVVWLTNFLSEIRNLINPRWWVEQLFLSVKRSPNSYLWRLGTLMIARFSANRECERNGWRLSGHYCIYKVRLTHRYINSGFVWFRDLFWIQKTYFFSSDIFW